MEKVYKIANFYVATLRAIYLIHQHSHWTAKGTGFYGDHLLFARLYESAEADADLAAEKFLGLFGENALDYQLQLELLGKILARYTEQEGNPTAMSLAIEKDFVQFCSEAYKAFKEENVMTLGLDDMIMSIASKREESCYLLQQTIESE